MRMTLEEFQKFIEYKAAEAGGDEALADKLDVSENYIYMVRTGRRDPGPSILEPLGVRKETIVSYVYPANDNS